MTSPFHHVACCIDQSPASEAGLRRARRLVGPGGRLSLVHVAPHALLVDYIDGTTVPSPADINVRQRRWLADRAAGVPGAEAVLLEGLPGPEICRWAEGTDVDLIVAGAHGGGWPMAVLGSVTRRLVDHAPCSVLVVRHEGGSDAEPRHATMEAEG